jgi:hypothetical protein
MLTPDLVDLNKNLRPGIQFWGFTTESSEGIIKAKIRTLVDEMALQKLSGLSI